MALGYLYRHQNDMQRAVAAFDQAGRLAPDQSRPWLELARTQLENGDFQDAESSAATALENAPQNADILMLNAEIALCRDNTNAALQYIQSVLRKGEDHPQALRLYSQVLESLDRVDEAIQTLDKAMPLFGYPLEMQLHQLRLIFRSEGAEAALPRLHNLIARHPDEPELLATLAEWHFQSGEGRQAVECARRALNFDQGKLSGERRADLLYLIGMQARKEGQLDQALHSLGEATAAAPDHMEAFLALGRTHQERRELRQAWEVFLKASELPGHDYRPYYYAGQVLKDLKDYGQAEKMLRRAAQLAPEEVHVHRLLGAVTVLNLVHNHQSTATDMVS
jgi:tetratricopeptide (TPR) repeat protein